MRWVKTWILIITMILIFGCALYIFTRNISKNNVYEITEEDAMQIEDTVNKYYESIINQDFYEALKYCELENSKIDLETRVITLQEVWNNLIEQFELEKRAAKVERYENGSFVVSVNINLKYKNTVGGVVDEIVYISKVNDKWKIHKIQGLDRYGLYRTGVYQYDRLIDFLNPEFK